jgi:hypothetical protein
VSDFNRDGRDDYAAVENGGAPTGQCGPFSPPSQVAVSLGTGAGTFAPPVVFAAGCASMSAAAADVDADGYLDLVVVGRDTRVFLGHGDGTFEPASVMVGGLAPTAAVVADFSGDGVADLAVANAGSSAADRPGSVAIFVGHGTGTFDPPTLLAGVREPIWLVTTDVNGDLLTDLAVVNAGLGGASEPYAVTVFVNTGGGTFRASFIPVPQPWTPRSLSSADLNGDGRSDLVLTAGSESAPPPYHLAIVLLGNGDGTFRFSAAYGIERWASQPLLADFDADGLIDMAVGANLSATIHVLKGRGDGTFVPHRNFGIPGFLNGFAVGNFGGDAKPDLLAATTSELAVQTSLITNTTP